LRTKVVVSLGPSTSSAGVVAELARAGASGFRINFAHGDRGLWSGFVEYVRRAEGVVGRPLTLIGDLVGSSVRIGDVCKSFRVGRGGSVELVLSDRSCEEGVIPLPNRKVFECIEEGDVVVMDDGRVRFRVTEASTDRAVLTALTDVVIKSRKALVVRGKVIDVPALTSKDLEDVKYACSEGFDYVGLSYVRSAESVKLLRSYIEDVGCGMGVIAKIETREAVSRLQEIVRASDAVLVARGDLGMNFNLEEIPRIQKLIVRTSREAGKPVIVATQLLESMIENPTPTRAEVVDVTTAVSEGVDALMLTGETAIGKYPVEAVRWLSRIVRAAEEYVRAEPVRPSTQLKVMFAKGVVELAEDLNAKLITYSMHGNTARIVSSLRPAVRTYVGVPNHAVGRALAILWGLEPVVIEAGSYEEGLSKTLNHLRDVGEVCLGDLVVMAYGMLGDRQAVKVMRVV